MELIPSAAWEHPLVRTQSGRVLIRRMAEVLAHLALADPSVGADPLFDSPEGRVLVRRLALVLLAHALAAQQAGAGPSTAPQEVDACLG
jgi:hypothetical protein